MTNHREPRVYNPYRYVSQVVRGYRRYRGTGGEPVGAAAFAHALNQVTCRLDVQIHASAITGWSKGSQLPDRHYLDVLRGLAIPGTWQHSFAHDLRAARFPGKYKPLGKWGKQALSDVTFEQEQELPPMNRQETGGETGGKAGRQGVHR